MPPAVPREVKGWAMAAAAVLILAGCAGEAGRIALQIPAPSQLPASPGSPRLAVRPVHDGRDAALLKSGEGWFLEYLPDEAFQPGPAQAVTQALIERLRACGRFGQVFGAEPDEGMAEAAGPPDALPPAELILEGDLQTFYVERNTVSSPFFSMLAAPLGLPLAALSGLRLLPAPVAPILPVSYRANLTMQVRLYAAQSRTLVWARTIESIVEVSRAAAADVFGGKEAVLKEVASRVLEAAMERLARQLPSADWLMARWPAGPSPASARPAWRP